MFNEKMISTLWLAGAFAGVFSVLAAFGQPNQQQATTRTDGTTVTLLGRPVFRALLTHQVPLAFSHIPKEQTRG